LTLGIEISLRKPAVTWIATDATMRRVRSEGDIHDEWRTRPRTGQPDAPDCWFSPTCQSATFTDFVPNPVPRPPPPARKPVSRRSPAPAPVSPRGADPRSAVSTLVSRPSPSAHPADFPPNHPGFPQNPQNVRPLRPASLPHPTPAASKTAIKSSSLRTSSRSPARRGLVRRSLPPTPPQCLLGV